MSNLRIGTLAVAVCSCIAPHAYAADLPVKAPPSVVVTQTWTGFYIGVNGGYGWGRETRRAEGPDAACWWIIPTVGDGSHSTKPRGGMIGGQIGYNYQTPSNWVWGFELAADWADLTRSSTSVFFPGSDTWSSRISALATATVRLGYAFGNFLPYIKGGYAGAEVRATFTDAITCLPTTCVTETNGWYHGWTAGFGAEWKFAPNWSVAIDYAYIDLESRSFASPVLVAGTVLPVGTQFYSVDPHIHAVTARLNWHFPVRR
jgi:outer membrane immunogenic protein